MQNLKQQPELISLNATGTAVIASYPALPPGEEIYDLMPPQTLNYPWWQLVLQVATVVMVFYLLWLFYRWITSPVVRQRKAIVQSPQKQALRAIERLKLSPVWQQRHLKEICEILPGILKTYAHDGFGLGIGAAATSDELMRSLLNGRIANSICSEIKELVTACDLIKYAGVVEYKKSPDELLAMLHKLVVREGWK